MKKTTGKRILAFLLMLLMSVNMVMPALAVEAKTDVDTTKASVQKMTSYVQQLKQKTTVSTTTGQFSWDTETKKYSWAYFNSLMLDAYMMIDAAANTSYVDGFYRANINSSGKIVNLEAGKPEKWALDNVEPIRAAFDLLSVSSNANRYKAGIQEMYSMLEKQKVYPSCGDNYAHKQDSSGNVTDSWKNYPVALDGLNMAQPFLMECANAIDRGILTLKDAGGRTVSSEALYAGVYNRFVWIYNNLYLPSNGLFAHGYSPENRSTNGVTWSRAVGWYAMALVDVIDMMPSGSRKSVLISELPRLFDGMIRYQDKSTGLWYNVTAYTSSLSGNQLETSGSAMLAYAMFKAYQNDWVTDEKYAEASLKAFNGVVANKMTGSAGNYSVTGTYRSSGANTDPSYYTTAPYTTNEAKGVGPLIMASSMANAVAQKYDDQLNQAPEELYDAATGILVAHSGATALNVADVTGEKEIQELAEGRKVYDIKLENYTPGTMKTISIPVPAGMEDAVQVYFLSDGAEPQQMEIEVKDKKAVFETDKIGVFAIGVPRADSGEGGSGGGDSGEQGGSGGGDSGEQGGSGGGNSGEQGGSGGGDSGEQGGSGGGDSGEQGGSEGGSGTGGAPDEGNPGSGSDHDSGKLSITIQDPAGKAADAFEAYQIFAGDVSRPDSITWGSGVETENGKLTVNGEDYTAQQLAAAYLAGRVSLNDMMTAFELHLTDVNYTATAPSPTADAVIDVPAVGYYYVKNADGSAGIGEAVARFLVKVTGEEKVSLKAKTDAPRIDKKVKNAGEAEENYREGNNVRIGDTVNYELVTHVPEMTDYRKYFFVVEDSMSGGLTYVEDSLAVYLAGERLTPDVDYTFSIAEGEDETAIEVVFKDFIQYQGRTGDDIFIRYDAVLNENAVIGSEGNPNNVRLIYSNDPGQTGSGVPGNPDKPGEDDEDIVGTTPREWTKTYVTKLLGFKYDGEDGTALQGAEFTLTGTQLRYHYTGEGEYTEEPAQVTITAVSDEDGYVDFGTLAAGQYTITETKAPEGGYNNLKSSIQLVVLCGSDDMTINDGSEQAQWVMSVDGERLSQSVENDVVSVTLEDDWFLMGIENKQGYRLPSTGGFGTTPLYAVSAVLLLATGVLLVIRRRAA